MYLNTRINTSLPSQAPVRVCFVSVHLCVFVCVCMCVWVGGCVCVCVSMEPDSGPSCFDFAWRRKTTLCRIKEKKRREIEGKEKRTIQSSIKHPPNPHTGLYYNLTLMVRL